MEAMGKHSSHDGIKAQHTVELDLSSHSMLGKHFCFLSSTLNIQPALIMAVVKYILTQYTSLSFLSVHSENGLFNLSVK